MGWFLDLYNTLKGDPLIPEVKRGSWNELLQPGLRDAFMAYDPNMQAQMQMQQLYGQWQAQGLQGPQGLGGMANPYNGGSLGASPAWALLDYQLGAPPSPQPSRPRTARQWLFDEVARVRVPLAA